MNHFAPAINRLCEHEIESLRSAGDDLQAVILATSDGQPVYCCGGGSDTAGKFGAMCASLAALGETVMRELEAGALNHVLLEGVDGKLVVLKVPQAGGALVLAVLAGKQARLGMILGQAGICVGRLAEIIAAGDDAGRRRLG